VEFINWAAKKGYCPAELVTEDKVALFLEEEVLYHRNRRTQDDTKVIGKSTIIQYIAALTSLWKYQVANKMNSHPTPRGILVQSIQKWLDSETFKVRKETYFDRGRLYQHLLSKEMKKNLELMAEYFWTLGKDSIINDFKGLCNRLVYLLPEQGLVRGENIHNLELPDIISVEYDDEGPCTCKAMVILKGGGKTNQYGKPLFSGYYCHSNVRLCAVSAAAFFLFY